VTSGRVDGHLVGTVTSRRQLLRVSAAAGAATALGGCGGSPDHQRRLRDAVSDHDVSLLNRSLGLERVAIAAYEAAIPLLAGRDKLIATEFLKQELLHAGRLIALINALGGPVTKPANTYTLGRPRTARQLVKLLHQVEQVQVEAYVEAIPELSEGHLRADIGSILAADAQHVAIIRGALGEVPVPAAFPTGAE
jgi:bacterioferritin (cytochrome b1)